MDGKVHSDKVSEKNKEGVLWNVELASNETGYLAEAFSKGSVEGCGLAPPDCL